MKRIVAIIPPDLVTTSILSSLYFFLTNHKVCGSLVPRKNIFFLFIVSRALLKSRVEFNRPLEMNFLTCHSCSYYSFVMQSIRSTAGFNI